MEKFVILKLMHQEHLDLQKMIDKAFDGDDMNKDERKKEFDEFIKKLERHFTFEEKAISAISQKLDSELKAVIEKIYADHAKLRGMFRDIEYCMKNDKDANLEDFLATFKQHHALEDMSLYPRLDKELSTEEKEKFRIEFEKNN